MKDGKVDISSFSSVTESKKGDGELRKGVMFIFYDDEHKVMLEVEMTFEEYGMAVSGHSYRNMKYKKLGE